GTATNRRSPFADAIISWALRRRWNKQKRERSAAPFLISRPVKIAFARHSLRFVGHLRNSAGVDVLVVTLLQCLDRSQLDC
ncbi:hypothetical protein ACC684_38780, partial [Rhizobium ruizarguesonis]